MIKFSYGKVLLLLKENSKLELKSRLGVYCVCVQVGEWHHQSNFIYNSRNDIAKFSSSVCNLLSPHIPLWFYAHEENWGFGKKKLKITNLS